jgi:hypothetical protein
MRRGDVRIWVEIGVAWALYVCVILAGIWVVGTSVSGCAVATVTVDGESEIETATGHEPDLGFASPKASVAADVDASVNTPEGTDDEVDD